MGVVYFEEKKYSEALEFFKKALHIREKHLPADHPDIIRIEQIIRDVSSKLT
jgi:hypothetical protein